MKIAKKLFFIILSLVIMMVLFIGGFVLYIVINDYVPEEKVTLIVENNQENTLQVDSPFSVLTYNIGYAGLDKDQDFFMDGGTMSRSSSKEQTLVNLENITAFIKKQDPTIALLQEVDVKATKSYHLNELDFIKNNMPNHSSVFAFNYKVDWVPVPLLKPIGYVRSGIGTFSKFKINQSNRFDLPGKESWPTQLFELDRCFVENRLPVSNGKELVLINTHLSAFDEGGLIRKKQLSYLKVYLNSEFQKGNYVIVGGDWNHILPSTDPNLFPHTEDTPFWIQPLPLDFTPAGYNWVVDKQTPSVRTLASSYKKDVNYLAVIDGFLVSANVEVLSVFGSNLEFIYSDHNPVTAQFILRK